jgi:hypothetical protein
MRTEHMIQYKYIPEGTPIQCLVYNSNPFILA